MATKKRTTSTRSRSRNTSSAKRSDGLAARTGRTIRDRPYASAAIATGAASIVAGVAGLFFMKKSGKTFGDVADDISAKSKEVASEAKVKVNEAKAKLSEAKSKMDSAIARRRDGIDPDHTQSEIMEEAMSLKEVGKTNRKPVDPVVKNQTKAGAIAY